MYCFAPSSTHEQPEDSRVESSRVTKSDAKIKKAKKAEEEEKPGGEPTTSTDAGGASPMSFIKSMTGGGAKSSGSRDSSRSVDYFQVVFFFL